MPATPSMLGRRMPLAAVIRSVTIGDSVNMMPVKPAPSRGIDRKTRRFGIA